jgi:acetyl-CoA carboxylase biotin carboxyl carrier protein
MDFDELKQILDIVREHQLTEFELERDGLKIKIKKDSGLRPPAAVAELPAVAAHPLPAAPSATAPAAIPATAAAAPAGVEADEIELAVVKSPIVGTFYRAPEPSAPPFVKIGDIVRKGQVLCILEAMKLMNEIESEYDGEVVKIYVENAQSVQYGERLFAIRTHRA